jgi:hypothetical protein
LRDKQAKAELDKKCIECGHNNVVKAVTANVYSSIRCHFEYDSNVTDASDLQYEKQDLQSTSTGVGI